MFDAQLLENHTGINFKTNIKKLPTTIYAHGMLNFHVKLNPKISALEDKVKFKYKKLSPEKEMNSDIKLTVCKLVTIGIGTGKHYCLVEIENHWKLHAQPQPRERNFTHSRYEEGGVFRASHIDTGIEKALLVQKKIKRKAKKWL